MHAQQRDNTRQNKYKTLTYSPRQLLETYFTTYDQAWGFQSPKMPKSYITSKLGLQIQTHQIPKDN